MTINYRKAVPEDAQMLVNIYNAAYYSDHLRYGACPGYGNTKETMEKSIKDFPKYVILCDNEPVGCISCKQIEAGVYEIGNLCIVPEHQGKGIGTQAVKFIKTKCEDWNKITLVTPLSKTENVKFYTEKCGFRIVSTEKDGNVELARFLLER